MKHRQPLSRRDFLRLSAFTAVGATIVACGPQSGPSGETPAGSAAADTSAAASTAAEAPASGAASAAASTAAEAPPQGTTAPIAPPSTFKEAPMLAAMVEANELPPVDQRLPKSPYVPPHAWLTDGQLRRRDELDQQLGRQRRERHCRRKHVRPLAAALAARRPGDRAGPGRELGVERRCHRMVVQVPRRAQVVRRRALDHRRHHVLVGRPGQR